ncbi:MAG: hypothetical protein WDN26_17125 [Chitinophagaceae bacterium]
MKRILSEKKFAALLFVVAFVVFAFAQQDAKKVEDLYKKTVSPVSVTPSRQQQPVTDNTTSKTATSHALAE